MAAVLCAAWAVHVYRLPPPQRADAASYGQFVVALVGGLGALAGGLRSWLVHRPPPAGCAPG